MNRLEEIIKTLKGYIGESIEAALEYLEQVLDHNSDRYNDYIQIKSRYKSLKREILLDLIEPSAQDIARNKISQALLLLSEEITEKDLRPEGGETKEENEDKRGEILYNVPDLMQVGQEQKCVVRIAFDIEHVKRDWEEAKDDVIKSIRVSETMAVSLLNLDENDPPFAIRSFSETVQFVDKDDFTEWVFYVKPLKVGSFPLLLKVSVIEMINNKEYKKDIVLEEKITVQTEEVPPPGEAEFKSAGESITLSKNPLPLDATTQSVGKRAAQGAAGALLKVAAMAAVVTVAAIVSFQIYEQKQDDNAWNSAKGKGAKPPIEEYLAKYPDGRHAEEAHAMLDSLNALSGDTTSLPTTSQGSETAPGTNENDENSGAKPSSTQQNPADQQGQTGKKGSTSSLPSTSPSSPASTRRETGKSPLPAAAPGEILRGQHFFFGIDRFEIVNSSGQYMDFKYFQFNQYREVLAIVGSIGSITFQPGMSVSLVPEKGRNISADLRYVAFTKEDSRYAGYFALSPNDLQRLSNEKFKRIRIFDAQQKPLGTFSLTTAGSKNLKKKAEEALRELDERQ